MDLSAGHTSSVPGSLLARGLWVAHSCLSNMLTMFFLQTTYVNYVFSPNNTIKWRIQKLSVDILKQTIVAAKRSGNLNSELGDTTALENDAQFMVFVRSRSTEDYVEQFFFCPLAKHTTKKEMFRKVDPFTK